MKEFPAMDQSPHRYMRLGLALFRAYPYACAGGEALWRAVDAATQDDFFSILEVGHIVAPEDRRYVDAAARAGRVALIYDAASSLHEGGLDLGALDREDRERAVQATRVLIDEAAAMSAERVNLSALASAWREGLDEAAAEALFEALRVLAEYARGGPTLALVSLPRSEWGGQDLSASAVTLVGTIREIYPEVSLTLDMSESSASFEKTTEMVSVAAPYLGQVYLAPLALLPGAEGAVRPARAASSEPSRVGTILRALFHAGYIALEKRPPVVVRVAPQPVEQPLWIVAGAKRTLLDAWVRL